MTPDHEDLVLALRAAGRAGPDADPRPVVEAADRLLQADPPDTTPAQRIAAGQLEPTRAEHIAGGLVQLAVEDDVTLPGGEGDPHRPLREWALTQGLCTEADLSRVWTARALRWGQAHGWLPGEIWDDIAVLVEDQRIVRAILNAINRGHDGHDDTAGDTSA